MDGSGNVSVNLQVVVQLGLRVGPLELEILRYA